MVDGSGFMVQGYGLWYGSKPCHGSKTIGLWRLGRRVTSPWFVLPGALVYGLWLGFEARKARTSGIRREAADRDGGGEGLVERGGGTVPEGPAEEALLRQTRTHATEWALTRT